MVRLREIAGPDLYRRNPFRVIGLATNAKPAQVRAQRHLLLGALELGSGTVPGDRRLALPRPPTAQEVRAAFDALERADHRLVDELFWWWGEPGACGCPAELHEVHDDAVEAHAKALDTETDEDLWVDAADAWMDALDHPRFWDHVRHRMKVLSDRRMDESTVSGLGQALPGALLVPQVALAGTRPRLAGLLDTWDVPAALVDDARRTAAAPTSRRIDELVEEVHTLLVDSANRAAADRVDELPALAELLEELAPHARYRWSARQRNRTAVMLNNCGLALKTTDLPRAVALMRRALAFVVEQSDRATIEDNLATTPTPRWDQQQPAHGQNPVLSPRWPSNLAVFAAFIAAVTAFLSGLLDAPTWLTVVAAVLFSWLPMRVITAGWYRSMGDVTTFVVGGLAFVGGWWAYRELPFAALAPFLWSCLAFTLVSPFVYALVADGRNHR
ncbi:hypothetical protein BBK82_42170 [Lentzea guizhouensis]|uniref:Uncharacterized protein n=1 Tax=Lentzea guizhouensis TaxID=1586287 RepID=A0A1B2HV69_9PSEU|nr:hypothetical protein BBK82_42170 [Lentzea guizhouensis]